MYQNLWTWIGGGRIGGGRRRIGASRGVVGWANRVATVVAIIVVHLDGSSRRSSDRGDGGVVVITIDSAQRTTFLV
jgi:hypothetical protein